MWTYICGHVYRTVFEILTHKDSLQFSCLTPSLASREAFRISIDETYLAKTRGMDRAIVVR